uniref:Alpha N-terminal protein methyltransferase 1B n=1 Tax=Electrophorus electricus TaxID=8005 RepID=A0A4W4EF06_ELEEL
SRFLKGNQNKQIRRTRSSSSLLCLHCVAISFYYRAQNFYKDVPASEEGMMGEFVELSELDLEGSRQFLKKFGPGKASTNRALDCGCGIGRVSKGVLLPVFQTLEMLDMMENFILHAHKYYLGDLADRVETYYVYNLQDFTPPPQRYDVIWMQWVIDTLDEDAVFLRRARGGLGPSGVIVLKDNTARQGCRLDTVDSSVLRHLDVLTSIIERAGLTVLDVQKQDAFPESIVPVWMIAMR